MKMFKKIKQTIRQNKKFILSTHVSPDPDALCSILALGMYLKLLGKKVELIIEEPVPIRYQFLPQIKVIKHFSQIKNLDYDAAIVVDCGELSRIGKIERLLDRSKPIINIDHHITNDLFGTVNVVDAKASSTAEIIYNLLKEFSIKINKDIATNIYIGIMTDTGSFRFENTTAATHAIAADLLKYNISIYGLYKKLYEMVPLPDMKAFVNVIKRFEIFGNGKIICLTLSNAVQKRFTEEFDLRDTVFKFLRSIKGVEVHVILTAKNNHLTRVNLRSSGSVNVAKIAQQFDGGGHRMASGCKLSADVRTTRIKIVEAIEKAL